MSILGDKMQQTAGDNSQQIQGQNVYVGMTYEQIKDLCLTLIQSELAIYKQKANEEAIRRFNAIMEKLLDALSRIDDCARSRFQEPAIQFAVNETFKEYIRSGSEELGDGLIDLMIERIQTEEHSTKQSLVDEARQILPKLSVSTLSLITILTFSRLIIPREKNVFVEMLRKLSPVIGNLNGIGSIDIAYLEQIGCGQSIAFFSGGNDFETTMKNNYDMLFRQPISIDKFNAFMASHGFNRGDDHTMIMAILPLMDTIGRQMAFKQTTIRQEQVVGVMKDKIFNALELLKQEMQPSNDSEVRQFFCNIDHNWSTVSEIFKRDDLKKFILSPVGLYIGSRKLSRIFGEDIPMTVFYHD